VASRTASRLAHIERRRTPLPERVEAADSKVDRWLVRVAAALRPSPAGALRRAGRFADAVIAREAAFAALTPESLDEVMARARADLVAHGMDAEPSLIEAFALIREVTFRKLGFRHHRCQLIGGRTLLLGMLAEMATGEGKTITALLAAATAAMAGVPVHVVTVNDYLADRDAGELRAIYEALGLTVGRAVHGLSPDEKRLAYQCDVVYGSNKEMTFDYLRDRVALRPFANEAAWRVESQLNRASGTPLPTMRGLHFAIVDEADSVLIDEARTPLILSSERPDANADAYRTALAFARGFVEGEDFDVHASSRAVSLTKSGRERVAAMPECSGVLCIPVLRDELVVRALSALHAFHRDQHYIVRDGKVEIVDEYTGRTMADRSWERGLHQMIELKEGCELSRRRETLARMTYQRFFRRYVRLAGMSGTAREVAGEIREIFGLRTLRIPTHRPVRRRYVGTRFVRTQEEKWAFVAGRAEKLAAAGRSVLIGTRSVGASEALSGVLEARGIAHTLLNARQDDAEAQAVAQAGSPGRITVATNMAGRGTDIKLSPETAEAGGLHVILTEFHESRRIDRQLFGRAGRQGDRGSCEAVVSLDDELFRRFLPLADSAVQRGVVAWLKSSGRLEFLRVVAQHLAEVQYRGQRMLGFNLASSGEDRLAFAGSIE
jgi:preprotein translocase subunit SecA